MSSRWLVGVATFVLGSTAVEARTSVSKVSIGGITSLAAAAAAPPPSGGGQASFKGDHESRLTLMMQKLVNNLSAKAAASGKAPSGALPSASSHFVSNENEPAFGFTGLNAVDSANVNGYDLEPPDQMLCVGRGFVFEGVNDALAVYSKQGKLLAGPAATNAFFGIDPSLNLSDPRCYYDSTVDRWFVTVTEYNGTLTDNHLMLAVSQSGDPTDGFNIYAITVTNDGSDFVPNDCPCFGDQPLIGADANGFYISTNSYGQISFEGAQIYAISKAALAAGAASIPYARIDQLSSIFPEGASFSVQPATTPPGAKFAPNTEYLAQSGLFTLDNQIVVMTINNTAALNSDLSQLSISVTAAITQTFITPIPAIQKNGPTPLAIGLSFPPGVAGLYAGYPIPEQNPDGDDQRMQQLTYLDGQLWTTVGTALVTNGGPWRDGAAWFVLNVSNGSNGLSTSVAKQGYVAGPESSNITYPALGVNSDGEATMVFTLLGPGFYPSAAFWKFGASHHIHVLAGGAAPEDGFSAYLFLRPRWGDYSFAAPAHDGSIWIATEMIPGPRDTFANWGTFIGRITGRECDDQ